jgi:hypothetical protein
MVDFGPELRRLLSEAGYTFKRPAKGDHELWFSARTKRAIVVDRKVKSRHTANGVLKQAGLPKKF